MEDFSLNNQEQLDFTELVVSVWALGESVDRIKTLLDEIKNLTENLDLEQ